MVWSLHKSTFMRIAPAFLVSLAVLGPACTSAGTDNRQTEDLDAARMRFTRPARPSYSFTWQQSCFCGPDQSRPIRISVVGGTLSTAAYVDDHQPVSAGVKSNLRTIQGVFDLIEQSIANHIDEVNATFDPAIGYPTHVAIDFDKGAADDEMTLTLTSFATPADAP
jgi:hypothetical protein